MNTLKYGLEIRAYRAPWNDGVELLIRNWDVSDNMQSQSVCTDMVFTKLTPANEGQRLAPAITLHADRAQLLMDNLWTAGFRPSEGSGSAGALAATERHLKDLQHLVFKTKPTP